LDKISSVSKQKIVVWVLGVHDVNKPLRKKIHHKISPYKFGQYWLKKPIPPENKKSPAKKNKTFAGKKSSTKSVRGTRNSDELA
jgi:hypothetical protein